VRIFGGPLIQQIEWVDRLFDLHQDGIATLHIYHNYGDVASGDVIQQGLTAISGKTFQREICARSSCCPRAGSTPIARKSGCSLKNLGNSSSNIGNVRRIRGGGFKLIVNASTI
jgi:hypothetical protein